MFLRFVYQDFPKKLIYFLPNLWLHAAFSELHTQQKMRYKSTPMMMSASNRGAVWTSTTWSTSHSYWTGISGNSLTLLYLFILSRYSLKKNFIKKRKGFRWGDGVVRGGGGCIWCNIGPKVSMNSRKNYSIFNNQRNFLD